MGKIQPAAAVLVCSTRELKWQGGAKPRPINGSPLSRWRFAPDRQACRRGIDNLKAHVENLRRYGVRMVVGLNRFATDEPKKIEFCLSEIAGQTGMPAVAHTGHAMGVKGGMDLARKVLQEVEAGEGEESFRLLYPDRAPLRTKIETVATQIYRAAGVDYEPSASQALDEIERTYGSRLNVVLSKTHFGLSDDKSIRGVPRERRVGLTDVRYRGGAGWVIVLLGGVLLMPGMDLEKCAARRLALGGCEEAFGGFVVKNLS